jgi:hypothetical protein
LTRTRLIRALDRASHSHWSYWTHAETTSALCSPSPFNCGHGRVRANHGRIAIDTFRARGGKLFLAHGWSDPALSARTTIEYFKTVQRRTPQASSFTRLFLMPGVLHCGGGGGCDEVDYASVIRRWVEQGEAPSRIVARKLRGTQVVRTHPLCAYPMTARYDRTGSTDDAASFTCR